MKATALLVVALGLLRFGTAGAQTFYVHHSDVPVPVPGGTATCFLDGTLPAGPLRTEKFTAIPSGVIQSFPVCIGTAFPADLELGPIAIVRLNLSANQGMRDCAALSAQISRIDALGTLTPLASGSESGIDVPQGKVEGTKGFVPVIVSAILGTGVVIGAGESVVLEAALTNNCTTPRTVFLAFDSPVAASRVEFTNCAVGGVKCAQQKLKAIAKKSSCLLKLESNEAKKGEPPGVKADACRLKFADTLEKIEAKTDCLITGDALSLEASVDAFVTAIDTLLSVNIPNKCQAQKINLVAKKVLDRIKCHVKVAGLCQDPDPACFVKPADKFAAGFAKAELGGQCSIAGDAAGIEAVVDAATNAFADALALKVGSPSGAFLRP